MKAASVDTIICPQCSAELPVDAQACAHCGSSTELSATSNAQRLLDRPWFLLILILHVGLLGIPAYWKTKYSLGVRLLIVLASIAYTVFAVGVIFWIGAYLLRSLGVI